MMKRMLGFLSCAWAGALMPTARPKASVSSISFCISFCIRFMILFLWIAVVSDALLTLAGFQGSGYGTLDLELQPKCLIFRTRYVYLLRRSGRPVSSRPPSLSILSWHRLLARVVLGHLPLLIEHLFEVIARRQLERWVINIGHEFLLPQELGDGQEVPVIDIRRNRAGQCTRRRKCALLFCPDVILERIAHDVLELSPMVGLRRIKCLGTLGAHHGVVEFPVLVAHRRWHAALVIEEVLAIRLFRLSGEVVDLVEPIELGLDDTLVLARHDLLVQFITLRPAGDFYERGHPVQRGEHFLEDRARLDDAGPAYDARSAHATFPRGQLACFEWRDAAVREGLNLRTVVGGEHHDGIVQLPHVF